MVIRSVNQKSVRVGANFKIEAELKKRVEDIARKEGHSLSSYLRKVVIDLIEEHDEAEASAAPTKRRRAKKGS